MVKIHPICTFSNFLSTNSVLNHWLLTDPLLIVNCYQALIHIFSDNNDIAREYCDLLEQLTVPNDDDGMKFLPELYMVTPENITQVLIRFLTTHLYFACVFGSCLGFY